MNCAYHPEVQAEAYCRTCGKPLCAACKRDVKGVIYCEDCIAAHVKHTLPAATGVPAPGVPVLPGKVPGAPNPSLAMLLGFIPGVGAMYNGQFVKAFVHILIFASLIWATNHAGGAEPLFGMLIAAFYFYMIFEAYKTARAKELGQPLPDLLGLNAITGEAVGGQAAAATTMAQGATGMSEGQAAVAGTSQPAARGTGQSGAVGAFVLIGIGVIFLLDNLGFVRFGAVARLWPVVLIVLGVLLLFRHHETGCQCERCRARGLMGPAVLITLGVLFLAESIGAYRFGFHRTWPLLLIVIGILLIYRRSASDEGHVQYVNVPVQPVQPVPPAMSATAPTQSGSGETDEVRHV